MGMPARKKVIAKLQEYIGVSLNQTILRNLERSAYCDSLHIKYRMGTAYRFL